MKVVILGCGRVGSRLAVLMESDGRDVSIIDSDPNAFDRLPSDFNGQTILGTGIDVDVLKSAGIESADMFAAVTNFDNTNIMACEVAKEIFGVPHVLARIYDPGRENFYHELGLETVCPTTLVANAVHNILSPERITSLQQVTPVPREADTNTTMQTPATPITQAAQIARPEKADMQVVNTSSQPAPNGALPTPNAQPTAKPQGGSEKQQGNGRGLRGLFRP